jgi:DNA-binding transcriptional MerR regulator
LEQIVALKFIGLPLKRIQALLDRDTSSLADALRMQRTVLEEKRRLLDSAIDAIRVAEAAARADGQPDAVQIRKILEVIEMQNNPNWLMRYYSESAQAKIAEQARNWTPELQAQCEQDWKDLIREIEAARGEDPAGATAQALADRWMRLVAGFTGGDPEVTKGLKALYADRANWPGAFDQQVQPFRSDAWEFISQAVAGRLDPKT